MWYKCVISYDGTAYSGWQFQPHASTVVGMLQDRFHSVFKIAIKITGASRTDASVHAYGQVAAFYVDLDIAPAKLIKVWNKALPGDIVIREITTLPEKTNLLCNVQQKTYHYHFSMIQPLAFWHRYCYFIDRDIDLEKLRQALQVFVGTHDFRSFCTGYDMKSTIRTIDSVDLEFVEQYQAYRITVRGPGFLRYMIRRIVGACLEVSFRKNMTIECLVVALKKCNPEQALPNAPAHGLCLYEIQYKKNKEDVNE